VTAKIWSSQRQGLPLPTLQSFFAPEPCLWVGDSSLQAKGIPKNVKYGGFKFMEAAHIKDVLAHLRVVPPGDDLSLVRRPDALEGIGRAGHAGSSNLIRPIARRGRCRMAGQGRKRKSRDRCAALLTSLDRSSVPPQQLRAGRRLLHPLAQGAVRRLAQTSSATSSSFGFGAKNTRASSPMLTDVDAGAADGLAGRPARELEPEERARALDPALRQGAE